VHFGLPEKWSVVESWLCNPPVFPPPTPASFAKKCPEIAPLPSYTLPPPSDFWISFPSCPPPSAPPSHISADNLEGLLLTHKDRGLTVTKEIRHGAVIPLKHSLPALRVPNTPSTATHGELFTDTVAHWINQGCVAGPFHSPPFPDSR
jgi:hypothetical protein